MAGSIEIISKEIHICKVNNTQGGKDAAKLNPSQISLSN